MNRTPRARLDDTHAMRRRPSLLWIATLSFLGGQLAVQAQLPLVASRQLSGAVSDSAGHTVVGAQVIVTTMERRASFATRTSADGRWSVRLADADREVLLYISASGFAIVRKRVVLVERGTDAFADLDVRVKASAVAQLDGVTVRARRGLLRARQTASPFDTLDAGSELRDGLALMRLEEHDLLRQVGLHLEDLL